MNDTRLARLRLHLTRATLVLGLFASSVRADDAAELTLAPKCGYPFQGNAVLQQKMPLPVWGTSLPGAKVTFTFGDQTKVADADDQGNWRVVLDPLIAKPLKSVREAPEGVAVRVRCEKDGESASVEYAWTARPVGSLLYNKDGLLAALFSTKGYGDEEKSK